MEAVKMFNKLKSRIMSIGFISALLLRFTAARDAICAVCDRFCGRPVAFVRKLQSRPAIYTIYHSFLIYLVVEMLSRRSPILD